MSAFAGLGDTERLIVAAHARALEGLPPHAQSAGVGFFAEVIGRAYDENPAAVPLLGAALLEQLSFPRLPRLPVMAESDRAELVRRLRDAQAALAAEIPTQGRA